MLLELYYVCVYCIAFLSSISGYVIYTHRNIIKEKYQKYTLIKKHVEDSTNGNIIGDVSMFWIAITILKQFLWIFVMGKIQRWIDGFCITETSQDHFTVQFCIQKKIIKVNLKLKRGPSDVIQVLGDDETDITDQIQPYFNYTHIPLTEKHFNCDKIDFYLVDGEVHDLSSKLKKDKKND